MTEPCCILSGAYAVETQEEQPYRWVQSHVEIAVPATGGLLLLNGRSPIGGRVRAVTCQTAFEIELQADVDVQLRIPVAVGDDQHVSLVFSDSLQVDGDDRILCFKLVEMRWQPLPSEPIKAARTVELAFGRGLPGGLVRTVFVLGWLRMCARRLSNGDLQVSGILLSPLRRREPAVLTVNSVSPGNIRHGLFNPDYGFLGPCAFEGVIPKKIVDSGAIRFGSAYARDGKPATPWWQDWWFPAPSKLPLPEGENMRRIGAEKADWFLLGGASFVGKLPDVLAELGLPNDLRGLNILDWGCGCGRLTRHLLDMGCHRVTGIDIDPVNIAWCKRNLPGAHFQLVNPDLPSGFAEKQFDLVIAHSVMTHLSELDQYLWLVEINRLLRSGGIAVLTVMGNYSAAIEHFTPDRYAALLSSGLLDVGWQNDGVDSQKPGFYRRVFHTADYISENWSLYFQLRAILEGYSDHQAGIVLQRAEP